MRSPEDVVKGRYLSRVTRCTKVVFNARLTSQDPLPFIQFESANSLQKEKYCIRLYFQMLLGAGRHILRSI